MAQGFWLSDAQRGVSPLLPPLQSGGRWLDVPAEYGPRKTLYNRFVRWSASRAQ